MKEGSAKAAASATELNSASAKTNPLNTPSNTSIPDGGTLWRVFVSTFAGSFASTPSSTFVT